MENGVPTHREIIWANCCTEGKEIGNRKGIPPHMFVVLTKKPYNETSSHFSALPITSKKEGKHQQYILDYGINITQDDVDGRISNFTFDKDSFILCDRPSRIDKKDLSINQAHTSRVRDGFFENLTSEIFMFFRRGRINRR